VWRCGATLCEADYASQVLEERRDLATLMPCTPAVCEGDDGKVCVLEMSTGLMGNAFGVRVAGVMGGWVSRDRSVNRGARIAAGAATEVEENEGLDMLPPFGRTQETSGARGVAGPSPIAANPIMDWVWYAQPHVFFARRTDTEG